jgi:hypothetical protein
MFVFALSSEKTITYRDLMWKKLESHVEEIGVTCGRNWSNMWKKLEYMWKKLERKWKKLEYPTKDLE